MTTARHLAAIPELTFADWRARALLAASVISHRSDPAFGLGPDDVVVVLAVLTGEGV